MTATDPNTVIVETDLEATPETVWRALSDPDLRGAWLAPGGGGVEVGKRFTLADEDRRIECEVLESEPPRRLRLGWRETGGGVASEVSFDLTPADGGGTHFRVAHRPAAALRLVSSRPAPVARRPTPPTPPMLRMAA